MKTMKTIWKNKIVTVVPDNGLKLMSDKYGPGYLYFPDSNPENPAPAGEATLDSWAFYKYADNPLYFIRLQPLTDSQKLMIIQQFDEWYGDTEQETTDWALEFQLITRMIFRNGLIINPAYLNLDDEMLKTLMEIIWGEKNKTSDIPTPAGQEVPWYAERWYREDLAEALRAYNIEVTEENIDRLQKMCIGIFDDKSDRNEMLAEKARQTFGAEFCNEE